MDFGKVLGGGWEAKILDFRTFFDDFSKQILKDFWKVLEGVWEAKILDFRTFFDVFSMSFFNRDSEGEKIGQKCEKNKLFRFLASGLRWSPGSWGKERIGERTLQIELLERIARKNV